METDPTLCGYAIPLMVICNHILIPTVIMVTLQSNPIDKFSHLVMVCIPENTPGGEMLRLKFVGGPLDGKIRNVIGYHNDGVELPCQEFKHGALNYDENGRIRIPTYIYHTYRLLEVRGPDDEILCEYHYEEGR